MKLSDLAAIFSVQSRGRGWVGLGVLALLLLAALVVAAGVPSLLRAGAVPTDVDVQPLSGDALKARTDGFRKSTIAAADRVIARAPFYPPKPKVAPPPPAPTRYTGPAIIGMVSDSVFFADGKRLKVGEPADGGLAIISTDAPWSAKLRYNGADFVVSLFEKDPTKLATGLGGSTTPPGLSSGPAPSPPAAPAAKAGDTPAAASSSAPAATASPTAPPAPPPEGEPQPQGNGGAPADPGSGPLNSKPAEPGAPPAPQTTPTPE